jgi:copper chaperone CopZ
MGRKTLIIYLISIISGALFFGLIINEFIPREIFLNAITSIHESSHPHEIIPHWIKIICAVTLTILIINGLGRIYLPSYFKKKSEPVNFNNNIMNFQTILVKGMTCVHCKSTVENGLRKINGITEATADLNTGKVILQGDSFDIQEIEQTITGLGYDFRGKV